MRYFGTIHSDHKVIEGDLPLVEDSIVESPPSVEKSVQRTSAIPKERIENTQSIEVRKEPRIARSKVVHVARETQTRPKQAEEVLIIAGPGQEPAHEVTISRVSAKIEDTNPTLLLGKFSFIKGGESYNAEAIRISNSLREFRWKVEPPYVIGALFDDNLSIQSNTGVVSREMIMGIEQLGYNFVAVESPKGVMTAWFKKEGTQ